MSPATEPEPGRVTWGRATGPGLQAPGYRAGGQRPSRASRGQPGRGRWGWLGAGLHIRACNGPVTGYSIWGRGYYAKAPRRPQGASGGLLNWGLCLEGYTLNRPSGNSNVFEQPSTNCKPSSGLLQRPFRFICDSGGITMSASIGCSCVMSTE